jgi:hypothetical protein
MEMGIGEMFDGAILYAFRLNTAFHVIEAEFRNVARQHHIPYSDVDAALYQG